MVVVCVFFGFLVFVNIVIPDWGRYNVNVHLVGEQDEIVRAKMVREDVAALRKYAPATAIDFEEIAEIGHFELVDPASATWSNVEKAIMKLLRSE